MNESHKPGVMLLSACGLIIHAFLVPVRGQAILFVKADAGGANDGSSWADAHLELQAALAAAGPIASGGTDVQIWVARSTYNPDGGHVPAGGSHVPGTGNRASTFVLSNGVALYAGFAGTEQTLAERDLSNPANETILSGDLAGDDGLGLGGDDNSYHVVTSSGTDASAVLDGFTIRGGNATGSTPYNKGGGVYNDAGSPTIRNCTFRLNTATTGGGIWNALGNPVIASCTFVKNGGSAIWNWISNPQLSDCIFEKNTGDNGGAIFSTGPASVPPGSSPVIINSIFRGNVASWGGAINTVYGPSHATLINCLVVGNTSTYEGGGVFNSGNENTLVNCTIVSNRSLNSQSGGIAGASGLTNCILWGNQPGATSGSVGATYSCVPGFAGTGNIGSDPEFVRMPTPGLDGMWDGIDDDYGDMRLRGGSPCSDAGDNTVWMSGWPTLDIEGQPRFQADPNADDTGSGVPPIIGMGAYETIAQSIIVSHMELPVPEGQIVTFGITLGIDPQSDVEVSVSFISGDPDLTIESDSILSFNSGNYMMPHLVEIAAADDDDFVNGSAQILVNSPGLHPKTVMVLEVENDEVPLRLYVDADATGDGNGVDWSSALRSLRDALSIAGASSGRVMEIWVAHGTYGPDGGYAPPSGPRVPGTGDRLSTFLLVDGVAVYGGFAGSEVTLAERDLSDPDNETILSGDLAGDDGAGFGGVDNSYHVVTSSATDASAVLDGFTIRGGNASASTPHDKGAGVYNDSGSPTIRNCKLRLNTAPSGGGMWNSLASPTIANCAFIQNGGSAIWNWISSPQATNCSFERNSGDNGGAVFSTGPASIPPGSSPVFINCIFRGNNASYGGAINTFYGPSHSTLMNCVLVGNTSGYEGGGIFNSGNENLLVNCTIVSNRSFNSQSGGIAGASGLTNCILWGNQPAAMSGSVSATYSCTPGLPGTGNISTDPQFVRMPDPGPDGNWDGIDDDYGDLTLLASSPCVDSGSNTANGHQIVAVDHSHNLRRADDPSVPDTGSGTVPLVDMGAFEWLSPFVPSRLYVNAAATGAGIGTDWSNAFTDLQLALTTVLAAGGAVNELWVAGGTYRPAGSGGDRSSAFRLLDGVSIYGHFAGTEVSPSERDLLNPANATMISGDLNSNDAPLVPGQPVPGSWGDNTYHVVTAGGTTPSAILDGFTIKGGHANGPAAQPGGLAHNRGAGLYIGANRPTLRNLRLIDNVATAEGGGLWSQVGRPHFSDVVIDSNWSLTVSPVGGPTGTPLPVGSGGVLSNGTIMLDGPLTLTGGTEDLQVTLDARSVQLDGPGGLVLGPDTALRISSAPSYDPVLLRTAVSGTGDIVIDLGQYLVVEGGACIDLSGSACTSQPCATGCDTNQSAGWGSIDVSGYLIVRDARIQNANIDVRLALLGDGSQIVNNDITLPEFGDFGGQFFVEPGAQICCNAIRSQGDRYLDLDPDPADDQQPTLISNNRFYVTIGQGVTGEQGELLELRSPDSNIGTGGGLSGAYPLPAGSAGFNDTWSLEELEVLPGAKVNLTNRQGFRFAPSEPSGEIPEALYVKTLVLDGNSVLNTGLQRLYYQSLAERVPDPGHPGQTMLVPLEPDLLNPGFFTNGSRLVDHPLLGFSLKVIALEDDTEFAVRVAKRLSDPGDANPLPPAPPTHLGSITREEGLDPANPANGVMKMCTHATEALSASSVAAHGAFARAGEEDIVVAFNYLFTGGSNAQLIVYLSDVPEPRNPADPNASAHHVQVAQVSVPASGPGSIGSGTFAVFAGSFSRGDLNFTRGTYVELELQGPDACVLIDEWDPAVQCITNVCGDFNGTYLLEENDFLYLLGSFGEDMTSNHWCLDNLGSGDHYVDLSDLLNWDTRHSGNFNLCGGAGGSGGNLPMATALPSGRLIVAAKSSDPGTPHDRLYPINPANLAVETAVVPPTGEQGGTYKLVRDGAGELYQVHGVRGLVRLSDGVVAVPPQSSLDFNGSTVTIGVATAGGRPLLDAAFDPQDPAVVYVVPVRVTPPAGPSYRAAAKLMIGANPPVTVMQLYGVNPAVDPCVNAQPPDVSVCNLQGLREIEVDGLGNVFVLAAHADNLNDWVLIYRADTGNASEQRILVSGAITAPTAMTLSADGNTLFLARTANITVDPPTDAQVLRYTIQHQGNTATGLAPAGSITVDNMRQVTAIVRDPGSSQLWILGFDAPTSLPNQTYGYNASISTITTPMLAIAAPNDITATAAPLASGDPALPISAVFSTGASPCLIGDLNGDGQVTSADIDPFAGALVNPTPPDPVTLCAADANADTLLDGRDVQPFVNRLLAP